MFLLAAFLFVGIAACDGTEEETTLPPILEDTEHDYYVTGNFAGWAEAFGDEEYEFEATRITDPALTDLYDDIEEATLLYTIDVTFPAEAAGWDVTYTIDGTEEVFDGNQTVKMARTTMTDGEAIPDFWMPSPESGEVFNLTPDTLFIPEYVDPSSSEFDPDAGTGDWNGNPVVMVPGEYTIVFAEVDGQRWMGAILNEEYTPVTDAPTTDEPGTTVETDEDGYPINATYPSGLYNYKFQTSEVRHTFMAAAEKYLMDTMYGGVPLFANGGFALYSSRLQLPVDNYVPVMGYGTGFATMTADDSTVLMADGEAGNEGEYTYRTTSTTNPVTWNQWLYDTSTDSDYMGIYMDAPYVYHFNADKTGYEVVPSMMKSNPVPVDSRITETGKEVSTTWTFEVRDDLEWFFHPDTDTSYITDTTIDAADFVATFKLALTNNWFRAVSGGGDFLNQSTGIKGAEDFVNEPTEANWANVGIKLDEENNTFTFEYIQEQSEWNVRYAMSSFVMTPIHMEMYEELGDVDDGGTYGTSNTTIAYHGAYYVDYYEADKTLVYKENTNYHTPDEYFYTGYEFQIINDAAIRFQEFVAGKLEAVTLPTENYDEYQNHPGLKRIPGATTFRMMINGLGTTANQQSQFPGSTYVPEPLLANDDFKLAMFYAIDRQYLAETVLKTSQTQMYYFSDAYLVEAEEGVPYRQTPQGLTVGEGKSPGTHGYNKDAAIAYWELAIEDLVDDGVYEDGDTIEMDFFIFSGSEAQTLLGNYIKATFEDTFQYDEGGVAIDVVINVEPKDFPGIYYEYMMTGNFDLSIGGISGSTLDAASFLDVFSDDNRGGFTLNWGIDTSTANIPVKYQTHDYDDEGNIIETFYHHEMWSFNAITSVLNGQKYITSGSEAPAPTPSFTEILPTEFTFEISEFDNDDYTNITYSIYEYGQSGEGYYLFDELENVTADSATITITGVKPYPYDYQIVVNYDLASGENEEPFAVSTWEYSGEVLDDIVVTEDSAVLTLVNDDNAARTFVEADIVVYDAFDNDITGDVTLAIDGNELTITDLPVGEAFAVEYNTNDGFTDEFVLYNLYASGATDPIVDMETTTTTMGIDSIDVSVALLDTRTVTGIELFDAEGTSLGTSTTGDLTVNDLEPNTTYHLAVTANDGLVQILYLTTKPLVDEMTVTPDVDSAEFEIVLLDIPAVDDDSDPTARVIASAQVFDSLGAVVGTTTVDANGIDVSVTGLAPNTDYVLQITSDEGYVKHIPFTTLSIFAEETAVTVTDTTANVMIALTAFTEGNEQTLATIVVDGNTLDVSAFNVSSLTFDLVGLTAEADYTITVTTTAGLTEVIEFTTEETPAAE
jgi:ABC-type oligopeptide transport system substrate-binding subunit